MMDGSSREFDISTNNIEMKYFLPATSLIFLGCLFCNAQSNSAEAAVETVVRNLFVAMQKGDSALARKTFVKKVTAATVYKDKTGNIVLRQEDSVEDFIKAIGTQHDGTWYEEIWNLKIDVDGDFAQVWCDYAFYVDKTFSHCGVDAMQLVHQNGEWRIFHLADTRRKSTCEVPEAVKNKHQ